MRYTTNPPHFIPPTDATIKHIAKREGLGELTDEEFNLVKDLLAKAAGATVRDFDEIAAQVHAAAWAVSEAGALKARHPGIEDRMGEHELLERLELGFHTMQHEFYEVLTSFDLSQLPGYNKVTQAIQLIKLYRTRIYVWVVLLSRISLLVALSDALEVMDGLDDQQMRLLAKLASDDESREDALMMGLELAINGINVVEMLRIARILDDLTDEQGNQQPRPDPNGEDVTTRDIEDLSELGRVTQDAFTLPSTLRLQRALSGGLQVRQPTTKSMPKQLLFMVLDGSLSMLDGKALSASRAAGIVMSRLQAVIDGEAEVYLRFFDFTLRTQEFHADSPESARELMRTIADMSQYGGLTTQFTSTLTAANERAKEIVQVHGLRDPEIVFVTDGQADVPRVDVLDGVVLHAFQVGPQEEPDLTDLARQSGGLGVYLGENWDDLLK